MAELTLEQKRALALARARVKAGANGGIVNRKGLSGLMGGVEQFGAGLNEGVAGFAGAPVDIATSLINGLVQRPQFEDTTDYSNFDGTVTARPAGMSPGIENPVGGSEMMTGLMDPFISDRAPDGMAERYLRRGGQEVGFGVPAALTGASLAKFGAPARASMPAYMATSLAGDVGAGLGGQTAQEIAPGNTTADFFASMIGGGGASLAASRMTPELAPVMTLEELKAKAAKEWDTVKSAPETLTDSATAGLETAVRGALPDSQLAPEAYPKAFGMADMTGQLKNPRIYDVEEARRIVGDRVAADPSEARVGVQMKKAIEEYLSTLKPADLQGGDAGPTLDALTSARRATHQSKKAETVLNKEMRAESRAATTGTGGNEVNATRQNIRALFDKERDPTLKGARQGFTPDEMAAMEGVVMGDAKSNIARMLGRMAPSSGALPMATMGWGGAGGVAAAAATGNPMMALPAIAGGVGEISKRAAEGMTKKQIERLLATILNNGKNPGPSAARAGANRAVIEQLLSGAAGGQPQ